MYDSYIVTIDSLSIVSSEPSYSLLDILNREYIRSCQICSAGLATCVSYVCSCLQDISCNGIGYQTSLRCKQLHDLLHVVVICSEVKHVSCGDVSTVLLNSSCDGCDTVVLSVWSDTFNKEHIFRYMWQCVKLSEFDCSSIATRNRSLLTELIMDHFRLSQSDQILVIEGFHLRSEILISCVSTASVCSICLLCVSYVSLTSPVRIKRCVVLLWCFTCKEVEIIFELIHFSSPFIYELALMREFRCC